MLEVSPVCKDPWFVIESADSALVFKERFRVLGAFEAAAGEWCLTVVQRLRSMAAQPRSASSA